MAQYIRTKRSHVKMTMDFGLHKDEEILG